MKILIKVKPNSKEEKIIKKEDGSFDVFVKAPAKDGKANKAVVIVLSEYFKVAKSLINIKIGHNTKSKIIEIEE